MSVACRDRVMALACVVGPISCNAAYLLIGRDLAEQVRQHGGIAHIAARHLDRPYLQRLLINANMELTPEAAFGAAMLARVPLTFSFGLDACAVYQQMQRSWRPFVRDGDGQRSLSSAQSAEVRHGPVQPNALEQALYKSSRPPQGQTEQNFQGQTGLNGGITVGLLSPPLAGGLRLPGHLSIKPDR